MVRIMVLLKRKPGLSMEEFIERYEREHAPLISRLITGTVRYERHYLRPLFHLAVGEPPEPEFDVVTEVWYPSEEAYAAQQAYLRDHPEVLQEIAADEERLFDRSKSRMMRVEDHATDLSHRTTD